MSKFYEPGKATMIIDGQFGSTGKGLFAAYVALQEKFDIATTNASANAGHTTILDDGRKFITFHLPTTACIQKDCIAYLNAGAIIDPEVLAKEMKEHPGIENRLVIHPNAAVIYQRHKDAENAATEGTTKTGSTQKGCGAALADKIMRRGNVASNDPFLKQWVGKIDLDVEIEIGKKIIVEVPQGFSLGLNSGMYPHVTSREVTPAQALSDAGLHPGFLGATLMTLRCRPIRVGSIKDADGNVVGFSGPGYPDQTERSWEELGLTPEVTTVTKRVRRVFDFSADQTEHALRIIRPTSIFLNFCNTLNTSEELEKIIEVISDFGEEVDWFGFGPAVGDIIDEVHEAMLILEQKEEAA